MTDEELVSTEWSTPVPNGYGGYMVERIHHGYKESIHGLSHNGVEIDPNNCVHFHKDGITVTKMKNDTKTIKVIQRE